MEPLFITRVFWLALLPAAGLLYLGVRAVVDAFVQASNETATLLPVIPGAMLAGAAVIAVVLSGIVYFTHSKMSSGICLGLLVATIVVLELPAVLLAEVMKK